MQKQVSKRKISILALSILLVLSLALTATFAAFTSNASVSGTVSFLNSIQIRETNGSGDVMTGASDKTIDININVGTKAVTFAAGADQLSDVYITAGGATFYWKATLTRTAGDTYFGFDVSNPSEIPNLGGASYSGTPAAGSIVWKSGAVANNVTLELDTMLAALPVTVNTANIGAAGSASGSINIQIDVAYNAF